VSLLPRPTRKATELRGLVYGLTPPPAEPAGPWYRLAIVGALLVAWGLASDPEVYRRSLGVNVNLVWGAALLALGVFLALGRRRGR
jgi:hypothetical protein